MRILSFNNLLSTRSVRAFSSTIARASSSLSSDRGRAAVELLPTYLADARSVERYSSDTPKGALQLGVAETQLVEDWLVPALNTMPELSEDSIYYQPTPGRDDFRATMATYIEDMCGLDKGRLNISGLVVGAGCNAVLENVCYCLAEAGDAVLIPTPYYAAFEFDLVARARLFVQPVQTMAFQPPPQDTDTRIDPTPYYPTPAALDAAYERAAAAGHPPRILLLSHPHNPLGVCYPASVVEDCIAWCRKRQVHLISDEIYAGSVYRGDFTSALQLADQGWGGLGPYVHWVYALSKDFGLSGLRVGAVYSENEEIRTPLQKLNDLCQISSQTQLWTASTLTRKEENGQLWVDAFRKVNHERLEERCARLEACLTECGIPFLRPTSGLFMWMDFSRYLDSTLADNPGAQERALYLELVNDFGLLLTPGWSMRNERPGFFRCVFTAAADHEFNLALGRFRKFALAKR